MHFVAKVKVYFVVFSISGGGRELVNRLRGYDRRISYLSGDLGQRNIQP